MGMVTDKSWHDAHRDNGTANYIQLLERKPRIYSDEVPMADEALLVSQFGKKQRVYWSDTKRFNAW